MPLGDIATSSTLLLTSDTISAAEGAPIGSSPVWIREVGAINANNATGAQQPLFTLNDGLGLPALLFDGSDDLLRVTNLFATGTWGNAFTAFCVFRSTDSTTYAARNVLGIASDATTLLGTVTGPSNMGAAMAGAGNLNGVPADSSTSPYGSKSLSGIQCAWISTNGTTNRAGINQSEMSGAASGVMTFASNNLLIGQSGNSVKHKGYIYAVAIYNAALSLADIQAVRDALLARFGRVRTAPEIDYFGHSQLSTESNGPTLLMSGLGNTRAGFRRNYAVNGAQAIAQGTNDMTAQVSRAIANFRSECPKRHGLFMLGTNETRNSSSTTIGLEAYAAVRAGALQYLAGGGRSVSICTILPSQAAGVHANFESINRPAFNNAAKADSLWAGVFNLDTVTELQDPNNTTYYNADKLHLVIGGAAALAAYVEPRLTSIIALLDAGVGGSSSGFRNGSNFGGQSGF